MVHERVRVIGAGLGRTGTKSLQNALIDLGYNTYHMETKLKDSTGMQRDVWNKWARAEVSGDASQRKSAAKDVLEMWKTLGVNATTDFPACVLYKELLETYPDAKVILSARRSGEKWARSFSNTIGRVGAIIYRATLPFAWILPPLKTFVDDEMQFFKAMFSRVPGLQEYAEHEWITFLPLQSFTERQQADFAKAHNLWKDHVLSTVPSEKLLLYYPGDGFEPLCSFLKIENCPAGPPRKGWNTSSRFARILDVTEVLAFLFPFVLFLCLVVLSKRICPCARKGPTKKAKGA